MKGYKAFKKGLICDPTGKAPCQYEEHSVKEFENAEICKSGAHFCQHPLDVLNYYPLVDEYGEMPEFAEVEALDEPITYDGEKFCTKKIKIGKKISFADLVKASIDIEKNTKIINHHREEDNIRIGSSGDLARIGSSGDSARIGSSGSSVRIGSSGDLARIGSSGDSARIGSSGSSVRIASSGDSARIGSLGSFVQIASSGDSARIGSSGSSVRIASSGDSAQIGSSGSSVRIASSGDSAQIASSGDSAQIASSGISAHISSSGSFVQIASSGDSARIGSLGNDSRIGSSGKNAVVMCAGHRSIAKAKKGSWITLSEWEFDENGTPVPICVKTEKVDGVQIKEDTFYMLKNGEFVEEAENEHR